DLPDDQASPLILSREGPRAAASRRERVDGDVGPSAQTWGSVPNPIIDLQDSYSPAPPRSPRPGSHRAAREDKDEAWGRLVDRLCAGNRIWAADFHRRGTRSVLDSHWRTRHRVPHRVPPEADGKITRVRIPERFPWLHRRRDHRRGRPRAVAHSPPLPRGLSRNLDRDRCRRLRHRSRDPGADRGPYWSRGREADGPRGAAAECHRPAALHVKSAATLNAGPPSPAKCPRLA